MASLKAVIRTNKTKADGTAPIALRISHKQKTKYIWLKRYISAKLWDANRQKAKGTSKQVIELNSHINKLKNKIQNIIDGLEQGASGYLLDDIFAKLVEDVGELNQKDFIKYLGDYILNNPNNLQNSTLQKYKTLKKHLIDFKTKLRFNDITVHFLTNFYNYLRKELGLKKSTVYSIMKNIRKLMLEEYNNGNIKDHPFKRFSFNKIEPNVKLAGERNYLTDEQIKLFENFRPRNTPELLTHDLFIFALYTGLRFSDIVFLTPKNIIKEKDGKIVYYKLYFSISKTGDPISFRIPLKAKQILLKYNHTDNDAFVFPVLRYPPTAREDVLKKNKESRNAYTNRILKQITSELEIDKNVSFHVARHSFATKALNLGISMEVVSKLLGHADLKTTQIYAKIVDKAKDDAMKLFD